MEENTTKERDQDKEIMDLLSGIDNPEKTPEPTKQEINDKSDNEQKIDILNLPPRKEVHNKKSKHIKIKFTRPYIRLVVVVLLIAVLFSVGFYIWGTELKEVIQHI